MAASPRLLRGEACSAGLVEQGDLLRQPEIVVGTWQAARREAPDLAEVETQGALHRLSDRRPWVNGDLQETTLANVSIGQRVEVVLDLYPGLIWQGEMESISPATGAEFAILPPQNASGNWVKVVQRLPVRIRILPRADEPPQRAGVTATVSFDTGR